MSWIALHEFFFFFPEDLSQPTNGLFREQAI